MLQRGLWLAFVVSLGTLLGSALALADSPRLDLKKGDHICLVGNTLAERLQHDGWFEAMFQSRFPEHELVVRNLGFSGDEVNHRIRSSNFGSPDEWLTRCKADVVFGFFGYNESWKGEAGLAAFKQELDGWVKHTLSQKYNGQTGPKVVLVSPPAVSPQGGHLPKPDEINQRIALYSAAMGEVAKVNEVAFIDLFLPSKTWPVSALPKGAEASSSSLPYTHIDTPLVTINGLHRNDLGNHEVAEAIDTTLFGTLQRDPTVVARLRDAIKDKDFHWFQRYRTTDGYSIYGGRADLVFQPENQTNRVVMQREMEILDQMTALRDQRIWAAAQGKDLKIDDSQTDPFIPVKTNKPGPGPNGEHLFLNAGEEAISKMTVHKGMKVNLFASEKEFPELISPVQMAVDPKGRVWVATWPTYPHWKPKDPMNDRLIILEDTDGDGKADKSKTFAGDLHNPTGFEFYGGGVFVAMAPDLLFLKDTDGDDKADIRIRVLNGLDSADTHHTSSSFSLDPGGALYFQEGTFHQTQVESIWGPPVRSSNAGVFRYEPRSQKFDVYTAYGFANPHGHVWTKWGDDIVHDGTGANPYHGAVFSGHMDYPNKHGGAPQVYQQRTRPCSGTEILSSNHFPKDLQGNLLVGNVIGFQGILQYELSQEGSTLGAKEVEPIVSSTDPNFRPADIEVGADGAIYFTDWHNPIIGHMQHNLRDPSRNKTYGRVYRVTYEGRELNSPPKIFGAPTADVVKLLESPENRVRYRAKIELSARKTVEVLAAVNAWAAGLDASAAEYEHQMMEALWMHQFHDVVNMDLLRRMLASKEPNARAAAGRVLCYWLDRVPNGLDLCRKLAVDENPRVRLEAVRMASFFRVPEAVEIPLIAGELPMDVALTYVHGETMKTLDPYWRKAIADKQPISFTSDAGLRFLVRNTSTDELLKMERTKGVCLELLFRPGVRDEVRRDALTALAKLDNANPLEVLAKTILTQDSAESSQTESVIFDLIRLLTSSSPDDLRKVSPLLETMATQAKLPITRQLGFVAKIAADGSVDPAWALASQSPKSLRDLLGAMPIIVDPSVKAALYPKVEPLLVAAPDATGKGQGTLGRYVRIELPRRGTLTLAEVEIYSDGVNLARQGKATQNATSHGGVASKAIDGNKNPTYSGGGQTHTPEDGPSPWWEVDLGGEYPIEQIVVSGRGEGFENRLKGYTLKILDNSREEVFKKTDIPEPRTTSKFEIEGGGSESLVRRAAMNALTYVRGQEGKTFKLLVPFVKSGADRGAAIQAILRIPVKEWPAEDAPALVESLVESIQKLPPAERTSQQALDAMQLGYSLASFLPADKAKATRHLLSELGVRVIRLGAVPHQMVFDKERLAIQAGKPIEFVFENADIMPHNFVILQPGALQEVGELGEAQAQQPGAVERQYIPTGTNKILLASGLLQPRQSQKLSWTAPTKPGVYPYVCTYPGHWRRMFGALFVVEDLEGYEADSTGYIAAHKLEPADSLLKLIRPRKEWSVDELAPLVEEMQSGRNFASAKQLFQVANCAACHRLNGVGQEIGQDLTKLDPKYTRIDVLRHVLDPSLKIDEKFASWIIETKEGKVLTGMILEETGDAIKVIENPLAKTEPLVVKKADIEDRKKSAVSMMPKGLFDKLTSEEILDLLAYVITRGDEKNPLFKAQ
jgi:putative heme-binding domain-containing protein